MKSPQKKKARRWGSGGFEGGAFSLASPAMGHFVVGLGGHVVSGVGVSGEARVLSPS
ncbi:MAG: hypothetical protein V7703_04095 [Hyphomicrobiales bacterium]